jgi:hypothetical protein
MRFTTNSLFATDGWTTSSATIGPCQGRCSAFFHRGDVVDHDGFRRNSNSSPVGVSRDHLPKQSKIRPGAWQCRKRSTPSKKITPGS